jgi:hypothetical protein
MMSSVRQLRWTEVDLNHTPQGKRSEAQPMEGKQSETQPVRANEVKPSLRRHCSEGPAGRGLFGAFSRYSAFQAEKGPAPAALAGECTKQ